MEELKSKIEYTRSRKPSEHLLPCPTSSFIQKSLQGKENGASVGRVSSNYLLKVEKKIQAHDTEDMGYTRRERPRSD